MIILVEIMKMTKSFKYISILLLSFSIVMSIFITDFSSKFSVIAFISLVLGGLGSVISIFIPNKYVGNFSKSDWVSVSGGFEIQVPAKEHGMGRDPKVQTFIKNEDVYEEVVTDHRNDDKGTVIIGANQTEDIQVRIS